MPLKLYLMNGWRASDVAIRDRVIRHYVVSFVAKLVGLGSSSSNVHTLDRLSKRNVRQLGETYMKESPKPYGSNQHLRYCPFAEECETCNYDCPWGKIGNQNETPTEPLRADGNRCKKEK
jgi:hypothetical protein